MRAEAAVLTCQPGHAPTDEQIRFALADTGTSPVWIERRDATASR